MVAGLTLGALPYLFVEGSVAGNHFTRSGGLFRAATLTRTMPEALTAFISLRWFLVPLIAIGPFVALRRARRDSEGLRLAALLAGALLLTFLFSCLRGDAPFPRVFLPALPAAALLVAASVRLAFGATDRPAAGRAILCAACLATSLIALAQREERLRHDLGNGNRWQNLTLNYFQGPWGPRAELRPWVERPELRGLPIVAHWIDDIALPAYAEVLASRCGRGSGSPRPSRRRTG